MGQTFALLDGISRLVVWGLFPRLLGLVYLIALASLYRQVLPIAGTKGSSMNKPSPLW
jgi:hypothetical protein